MRRVYLDHAATTPVAPEVRETIITAFTDFGNPSSLHEFGRQARESVDHARLQVANLIGADPDEVVFTGGGTEADNLAVIGTALAAQDRGRHIISSRIEHHAVLHTCEWLESQGWDITLVDVDGDGMVDPDQVKSALRPDTVLVSIMAANNEVGTVQPIRDIAAVVRDYGCLLHTDAVQAVGQEPTAVKELDVDLLTLSAHKIYGPKGIGALYVRRGLKIEPIMHGGGHEFGLRAGTENVPGILGLGEAARLALEELDQRKRHLLGLRSRLYDGLCNRISDLRLNGHAERRLPGNLNISFKYVEGEAMLLNLDLQGIAVSSGSACTSGALEPSHVLRAMGLSHALAQSAIRMTLGVGTTDEDVDYVLQVMPDIVDRLRQMSPLASGRRSRSD